MVEVGFNYLCCQSSDVGMRTEERVVCITNVHHIAVRKVRINERLDKFCVHIIKSAVIAILQWNNSEQGDKVCSCKVCHNAVSLKFNYQ